MNPPRHISKRSEMKSIPNGYYGFENAKTGRREEFFIFNRVMFGPVDQTFFSEETTRQFEEICVALYGVTNRFNLPQITLEEIKREKFLGNSFDIMRFIKEASQKERL